MNEYNKMTPEELSDILPAHVYMLRETLMGLFQQLNQDDWVTPDLAVLEDQFHKMFFLNLCDPPRNYADWHINETVLDYIKEAAQMRLEEMR